MSRQSGIPQHFIVHMLIEEFHNLMSYLSGIFDLFFVCWNGLCITAENMQAMLCIPYENELDV